MEAISTADETLKAQVRDIVGLTRQSTEPRTWRNLWGLSRPPSYRCLGWWGSDNKKEVAYVYNSATKGMHPVELSLLELNRMFIEVIGEFGDPNNFHTELRERRPIPLGHAIIAEEVSEWEIGASFLCVTRMTSLPMTPFEIWEDKAKATSHFRVKNPHGQVAWFVEANRQPL